MVTKERRFSSNVTDPVADLLTRNDTIDEQVGAILFLASAEASYITGSTYKYWYQATLNNSGTVTKSVTAGTTTLNISYSQSAGSTTVSTASPATKRTIGPQ